MNLNKLRIINGNDIKLLAALLMLIDHIGLMLLPQIVALRDIGRIAMPLFAYMVAEGCRYTKDKIKHFALIFVLGIICQIVYYIFDGSLFINILLNFSLSILIIYSLQFAKKCLFDRELAATYKVLAVLMFASLIVVAFAVNCITEINGKTFTVDYGFWGCMLPVFAALLDFRGLPLPEKFKWLDGYYLKLIPFTVGILAMCITVKTVNEWYSLIALVPLLLYSGERGDLNLKYFFYIFYPAHLVVLQVLTLLI
jgi:hypothetical protein